jgi:DNA-binding cell septation regulator SpoVG
VSLTVTSAGIVYASEPDNCRGLIGYITLAFNDALMVDGITLRRTRDGAYRLSFPERTDGRGRRHPIVRPLTAEDRASIEGQVFDQLGIKEGATL